LSYTWTDPLFAEERPRGVPVPILELEPDWLTSWTRMVGGVTDNAHFMVAFTAPPSSVDARDAAPDQSETDPRRVVERFMAGASPAAFQLAGYLAAAPLSLPMMRHVQRAMFPKPRPLELAEVYLGGLMRLATDAGPGALYEFLPGVRDVLLDSIRRSEALKVSELVSAELSRSYGTGSSGFSAFVPLDTGEQAELRVAGFEPYSAIEARVLQRIGGSYARTAATNATPMTLETLPAPGAPGPEAVGSPGPQTPENPEAITPKSPQNPVISYKAALLVIPENDWAGRLRDDMSRLKAALMDGGSAAFDNVTVVSAGSDDEISAELTSFLRGRHTDDLVLLYLPYNPLEGVTELNPARKGTRRPSTDLQFLAHALRKRAPGRSVVLLDCHNPINGIRPGEDDSSYLCAYIQDAGLPDSLPPKRRQLPTFAAILAEGIASGDADLNHDGDITLSELWQYTDQAIENLGSQASNVRYSSWSMPPVIAVNVHWQIPDQLRQQLDTPVADGRLRAVMELGEIYRTGNNVVRRRVGDALRQAFADPSPDVADEARRILGDEVRSLTGQQVEMLLAGLVATFDEDSLYIFLDERLDKDLDQIIPPHGEFRYRVFTLIRMADQGGWMADFIREATRAHPENATLVELARETGVSDIYAEVGALERIVRASGFQNTDAWRQRLAELQEQVCHVEVSTRFRNRTGTGVLVAPDLILTTFQAIAPGGQTVDLRDARMVFGQEFDDDGVVADPGSAYRLDAEAIVAARHQGPVDSLHNPGSPVPSDNELDFALLRLATPAGRAQVPGTGRVRGWAKLAIPDPAGLEPAQPLLILQLPEGEPPKLTLGESRGLNGNGTRLRHNVSTTQGSSGAPCLNTQLEVVAIQQSSVADHTANREPLYNSAIPVAAILQSLAGTAVARDLEAVPEHSRPTRGPAKSRGPIVMPFYLVCDVSHSMANDMAALNDSLARLYDSITTNPLIDDVTRLSIITFSDGARVVMPLTPASTAIAPRLTAEGGTNYGSAFRRLAETISEDTVRLKADGYQVYRPCAFFLTDGEPLDHDWLDTFTNNLTYNPETGRGTRSHPVFIPIGFRDAPEDALRKLAYPAGRGKWYRAQQHDVDDVLRGVMGIITSTVVASVRSVNVGNAQLILSDPNPGSPMAWGTAEEPDDVRIQGSTILWVDDRPDNNRFERQALEELGIRIDISTSTEDALPRLKWRSYDMIISDMGRPPDTRAGYTLLDQLRKQGDQTPYLIYAGSRAPEHIAEARRHGAIGCTNLWDELVRLVTSVLSGEDGTVET
jgi:uncharacterized protein YegL